MAQQIKADRLAIHLASKVVQRHQQGRGKQIRLGFDVAPLLSPVSMSSVAAFEQEILLMAVQDVVAELMRDGEALSPSDGVALL